MSGSRTAQWLEWVDYGRPFPATERQLNDHTPAVHTSMAGVRRAAANRIGMVEVSVRPGGDVEFGPQMRTLATVRAWRKVPLNVLSATRNPSSSLCPRQAQSAAPFLSKQFGRLAARSQVPAA